MNVEFHVSAEMKRQGRRTGRATRKDDTSEGQDEPTRKSCHLRKRKCETEQNVQDESLVNENAKRRCLKNDDQRMRTQHKIPAKGQKMQHTKMDTLKEKRQQPRIQNNEALLKQPIQRNVIEKIQTVGTKRLTRLSMNSKRKTSDSNPPLIQKKAPTQKRTQVKGEQLSKMKLTKKDKDRGQKTLHGTPKPGKKGILQGTPKPGKKAILQGTPKPGKKGLLQGTPKPGKKGLLQVTPKSGKKGLLQGTPQPTLASKAPGKEMISNKSNPKHKTRKQSRDRVLKNPKQTKETQIHSNIQQTTVAKHCRISKPKMMKRKSTTTARKVATKNDDPVFTTKRRPTKDFSTLFLKKVDARFYPEASDMSNIHGISVSNDNLIWVNHLRQCVQLLNSSGEVLRTIDLDHSPVFSCCTPSGDLLETQGYTVGSKPVITMISRDGNIRLLADLSSYATNLCGILCKNETIFVVGCFSTPDVYGLCSDFFIVKLSMSGEVEGVYNSERNVCISHVISLNGQIIALRNIPEMFPLKGEIIASEKVNGVCMDGAYSASASVDNLGNVILGSNTELMIVDPSLEFMHKIEVGIRDIVSTAVDKNNQLWFGTESGGLYSAQYLK